MDPIIKRQTYIEIDAVFQNRNEQSLKNYTNEIKILEDVIELSFYLLRVLEDRNYDDTVKSGKPLSGPKALIPILYHRNIYYLIATHKLTLNGLINPAHLNLRVVFETIMQIYLLHLTEKEADLLYKSKLNILEGQEIKDFKKKYEKLRPIKVRKTLYSGDRLSIINKLYHQLSNSAHPNIESAMNEFQYKSEAIKDVIHTTLVISFANIVAIHESYFDKFDEEEIIEISNTFDKITNELGFMIDMIPNNPNLDKKPKIVL